MIKFFLQEIKDLFVRENFISLNRLLRSEATLKGNFKFFTYTFTAAATGATIQHTFGFVPKDVILLSVTNGATVTFNYDNFTRTTIEVTSDAATTFRAFFGKYED